jgi:adenine deaminase
MGRLKGRLVTYKDFLNHKADISADLAAVAMGRKAGDLIIKNARLVNVLLAIVESPVDIVVYGGIIAFIGDAEKYPVEETTYVIDAQERYLMPGLIDSHMHVESSMVDLVSFASAVIPHGTTTICPDIHEMTNVLGLKAVELFYRCSRNLPLNILTAMPVCVPSLPGMEDGGAEITADQVKEAYSKEWAALQGEQMNFPGVIFGDPHVHAIGAESLRAGKVMTGHYSSPDMQGGLNGFIAAGMTACHESTRANEAIAKASRGMYVQMRYGSAWLDLPNLVPAILENPEMDTRMFTMVTDDVTPCTIAEEGHLIRVLREAVRLGVPTQKAIQMVTINAAQLLGMDQWIGSVSPGRAADFILVDNLKDFNVHRVFTRGKEQAIEGRLVTEISSYPYPTWALKSVYLPHQNSQDFIILPPPGSRADKGIKTRVIEIIPGMVFTREKTVEMLPENNEMKADPLNDLTKLAMIYRHEMKIPHQSQRASAFVKGLGFKPNTAYASTVSHDCHNLLVLGTDDESMAIAANCLIDRGGGLAVVQNNKVLAHMELPFAGLMSLKSVPEAAHELLALEEALKKIGCPHDSAEMTISLLGLVVLPELHLSNKGLVRLKDGNPPEFVDLFM